MKRVLYVLTLLVLIAVFLYSGWSLFTYYRESGEQTKIHEEIAQMVESAREQSSGGSAPVRSQLGTWDVDDGTVLGDIKLVTVQDPDTGEEVQVMEEYAELYLLNNDVVGWIQIPDTVINYPVMHTPGWKDYYLHVDLYDEYSNHGSIYAREECDFLTPSDNVTIYGHNMKDGTMFAALRKYEDRSFWEDHQYIFLDTLTQRHIYQVICVFQTTASVGEGFGYHLFVDAADEAEYNEYISTCQSLAMYDTGLSAEYGDKLITLSTCVFNQTNGRLVVVAKRITK